VTADTSALAGYVSHPSLGEEAVPGQISFAFSRLCFEAEGMRLEMPLSRLVIERGTSGDQRIFFSDPEQPDWTVFTFEEKILRRAPLLQQPHTRHQIETLGSGRELRRRVIVAAAFVAGFALVALLVSILTGFMVRSLAANVPAQWERDLGDQLMAEIKENEVFVEDAKLKSRLDLAVAPLLTVLPRKGPEFKFHIIEGSLPNAFALPGGHVMVNTGLLALAEQPGEIAGVIAHELAHVTQKHGFRKIIADAGPYLIMKIFFGGGNGTAGLLGASSQLLVQQSFSQEFELEADDVGWSYLVAARIDPRGLATMLRKLKAAHDKLGFDFNLGAFSTHPADEKRLRRLDAKWTKLKNKSGFIEYERTESHPA
jgi:beta-barrel assembly-enhancing protease